MAALEACVDVAALEPREETLEIAPDECADELAAAEDGLVLAETLVPAELLFPGVAELAEVLAVPEVA